MSRWYLSRLKDENRLEQIRRGKDPFSAIIHEYVVGNLTLVRKAPEELVAKAFGEVVFDIERGQVQAFDGKTTRSLRPFYPCPDCGSRLILHKKYFKFGNAAVPWFYVCQNKDKGCSCKAMAKMDGSLLFIPADAQTRRARKLTTEQFDRLWQAAPELEDAHEADPAQVKALVNRAKARAYKWLAQAMEEAGCSTKNISQMDIPTLRVAYRLCRDADMAEIVEFESIEE